MPIRLFAAAWSYELASWFAFLSVVSWLEARGGAGLSGAYFVLYNGVQLPAAALLGPWLDRLERGWGLRLALFVPVLPLFAVLAVTGLWSGLVLGAAFALSDYLLYTLVPAAVPLVVPAERVSRANAFWQAGSGAIFVAAPAASGWVFDRFGALSGVAISGAFLLLALFFAFGLYLGRPEGPRRRGGWREAVAEPLVVWTAASVFLLAAGGGLVNAALPVLTGGGRDYGLLLSALGAGSLLATLVLTRRRVARPLRLALFGALAHVPGDLALALGAGLALYLPAGFVKGVANAAYHLGLDTALQLGLPGGILARAFSLGWAVGNLGQVLGAGAFGLLAPEVGARSLLFVSALFALLGAWPLVRAGAATRRPRG